MLQSLDGQEGIRRRSTGLQGGTKDVVDGAAPARSSRDSRSVCEGGNSGQVGIGGARGPSTRR